MSKKRKSLNDTKDTTEVVNYKVPVEQIDQVRVTAVQYGVKLTLVCYAAPALDGEAAGRPHTVVFEKRISAYNGGVSYHLTVDDAVWFSTGGSRADGHDETTSHVRAFNDAWGYYTSWSESEERTARRANNEAAHDAAAVLFGGA